MIDMGFETMQNLESACVVSFLFFQVDQFKIYFWFWSFNTKTGFEYGTRPKLGVIEFKLW